MAAFNLDFTRKQAPTQVPDFNQLMVIFKIIIFLNKCLNTFSCNTSS